MVSTKTLSSSTNKMVSTSEWKEIVLKQLYFSTMIIVVLSGEDAKKTLEAYLEKLIYKSDITRRH